MAINSYTDVCVGNVPANLQHALYISTDKGIVLLTQAMGQQICERDGT